MLQIRNLTGYTLLLIAGLLLFPGFIKAADTDSLPKMQGAVTDTVGLLTVEDKAQIDSQLMRLEKEKGAQVGVLIVGNTGSETIESYAEKVFNYWRLGRLNIDDGILLVVALDDRAVRIEVGYGLEGVVTDVFAAQIIDDYLIPNFRRADYAAGIKLAVDALCAAIMEEPLPPASKTRYFIPQGTTGFSWIDIPAGLLIGGSFLMWIMLIYSAVKRSPLKAGIPIASIFFATWIFGGFDFTTYNGLEFGEDFMYTDLPQWVQLLLLQYLPVWMTIVMFFSMFIVAVFFLLFAVAALAYPFVLLYRKTESPKLKKALIAVFGSMPFAFFGFIFTYVTFNHFTLSACIAVGIAVLMGFGIYTGKVKPASGSGGTGDGRYRSRSSNSSGGSSRSSSSSRSSGGGGRSGGGGSSGRW